MSRSWFALFGALLLLLPGAAFAQSGDDDPDDLESDDEVMLADEELDMEDEALPDYYNDGISMSYEDGVDFGGVPDDTYIWSYRGGGDSLMAFAVDVLNDNVPAELGLHDWDITGGSDEEDGLNGPPTAAEIRTKLEDEQFSPLKQVLSEGPIEGEEVSLMVLVPDSVLTEARTTQMIPNVAILKAVTLADQLTNGLKFVYTKRQDEVQFQPGAQTGVPQLQYDDAKVFAGVVQFHFNLGMSSAVYEGKRRGAGFTARADVPSQNIADGYDRAREEAMRLAVRRAIGDAARGMNQALADQVTGRIDFYEITNEGFENGIFTVEIRAWVTVDGMTSGARPVNAIPRAGEPIVMTGSNDSGDDWG